MRSFRVGGAVRDALLGLPVNDTDWVVVGATPDEMIAAGYLPVGKDYTWEKDIIPADYRPLKVSCGQHPWMSGYMYVLEHPYFAVTDEEGKFEIKLAPTGARNLVIWHETGLVTDRMGKPIEVKAGQVTDAGKFEVKPKN